MKLHRHTVEGGYIEHRHATSLLKTALRDRLDGYNDGFDLKTHTHILVLSDRNYISEFTGKAEWL